MTPRVLTHRQQVSLERARKKALRLKALRVKHPSPRDVLLSHLDKRSWDGRRLADRLSAGDPGAQLRKRALIGHYLTHPTGDIELGSMIASALDEALALPRDSFRKIERAWIASRRPDQV